MLFIYILIITGFLYILQIGLFTYGFKKIKPYKFKQSEPNIEDKTYVSLIIPFKNEEKYLPKLIESLKNQTLNKNYFKIVFVDDHSTDTSVQIIQGHITENSNWELLTQNSLKGGKKNALLKGISETDSELIVTSDADCIHPVDWLKQILFFYLEHDSKMIIGPVLMKGTSFFQKVQSLEFLSLSSSTAGATGINHPTMCSAANLAYKRDTFETFKDALYLKETSGDDVFLMHTIKQKYAQDIHYIKSNKAVVYTEAEKSFSQFFKQRLRWVSKSKSYFDLDTIISSILVLLVNIFIVSSFIVSFFDKTILSYFILLFLLKLFIDFILLYVSASFFKQSHLLYLFPLLSLFYPFYIVITAFTGLFIRKVKWRT